MQSHFFLLNRLQVADEGDPLPDFRRKSLCALLCAGEHARRDVEGGHRMPAAGEVERHPAAAAAVIQHRCGIKGRIWRNSCSPIHAVRGLS